MKTKAIQLTAILMILSASVFAQVSSEKPVEGKIWTSMTLKGQDKVELRMIKPADATVTLCVYDARHNRVLKQRITHQRNLWLLHDIAEFPAGTYTYEIRQGKETIMETSISKKTGQELKYLNTNSLAEAR